MRAQNPVIPLIFRGITPDFADFGVYTPCLFELAVNHFS